MHALFSSLGKKKKKEVEIISISLKDYQGAIIEEKKEGGRKEGFSSL